MAATTTVEYRVRGKRFTSHHDVLSVHTDGREASEVARTHPASFEAYVERFETTSLDCDDIELDLSK